MFPRVKNTVWACLKVDMMECMQEKCYKFSSQGKLWFVHYKNPLYYLSSEFFDV